MGSACSQSRGRSPSDAAKEKHAEDSAKFISDMSDKARARRDRRDRISNYRAKFLKMQETADVPLWRDSGVQGALVLLDVIPVPAVVWAEEGTIGCVNAAAAQQFGYAPDGVKPGTPLADFLRMGVDVPAVDIVEDLIGQEVGGCWVANSEGGLVPVNVCSFPIEVDPWVADKRCEAVLESLELAVTSAEGLERLRVLMRDVSQRASVRHPTRSSDVGGRHSPQSGLLYVSFLSDTRMVSSSCTSLPTHSDEVRAEGPRAECGPRSPRGVPSSPHRARVFAAVPYVPDMRAMLGAPQISEHDSGSTSPCPSSTTPLEKHGVGVEVDKFVATDRRNRTVVSSPRSSASPRGTSPRVLSTRRSCSSDALSPGRRPSGSSSNLLAWLGGKKRGVDGASPPGSPGRSRSASEVRSSFRRQTSLTQQGPSAQQAPTAAFGDDATSIPDTVPAQLMQMQAALDALRVVSACGDMFVVVNTKTGTVSSMSPLLEEFCQISAGRPCRALVSAPSTDDRDSLPSTCHSETAAPLPEDILLKLAQQVAAGSDIANMSEPETRILLTSSEGPCPANVAGGHAVTESLVSLRVVPAKLQGAKGAVRFQRNGISEELANAVDCMSDAVVLVSANGTVLHHNVLFGFLFDCSLEEVVGKDVSHSFVPSRFRNAHIENVSSVQNSKANRRTLKRRRIVAARRLTSDDAFLVELSISEIAAGPERDAYLVSCTAARAPARHIAMCRAGAGMLSDCGVEPPEDWKEYIRDAAQPVANSG